MSVDVPDPPVMLVGLTVAVRPGDGLVVRLTVPVKPLTGVTVTVHVAVSPALTLTLVQFVAIVKLVESRMWTWKMLWNVNVKKTK